MGGRGGSSHSRTVSSSFTSAQRMASRLSITLNLASLRGANIQPKYVRETLRSVKAVYTAFPAIAGRVKYIDAGAGGNAYASAGGDGGLHMGIYGRASTAELNRYYNNDLASHFHPAGTTPADIFVHEMGHQMESYLNERDYGEPWRWGLSADKIVLEGISKVNPAIHELHSAEAYELAKDISQYAVVHYDSTFRSWDTSETLAEAVADYHANGELAKPLSREIWKILQREMKT